jgi:hypothetical protein
MSVVSLKIDDAGTVMDEKSRESRYAVGDRPANPRTAGPALRESEQIDHPEAVRRAQQLRARHELGAPLAELLQPSDRPHRRAPVPASSIAGALAGTGLLLGAMVAPGWVWPVAAVALAGASYGAAWWGLRHAQRAVRSDPTTMVPSPPIDRQAVEALDRLLDEVAPQLSPAAREPLQRLKDTIVRLVGSSFTDASASLTSDDRLYLHECLRRYLPDSLTAYLKVPAGRRDLPLNNDGITATRALCDQLALMEQALNGQEAKVAASAGEALLRQQEFLRAKARHGP